MAIVHVFVCKKCEDVMDNTFADILQAALVLANDRRAERMEAAGAAGLPGDVASAEDPECTDATS